MSSFSSHFLISAALRGAALIGGRRLYRYLDFKCGAYWRKYGMLKPKKTAGNAQTAAFNLSILPNTLSVEISLVKSDEKIA